MNRQFDIKKPVAFRGNPTERLRVLADDLPGPFPITVADPNGNIHTHMSDGSYYTNAHPDPLDLINIPEVRTVWVNFYNGTLAAWHASEEIARANAGSAQSLNVRPIAVAVPVTFEVEE